MALDHSLTYRQRKLRHLPHRLRLRHIRSCLRGLSLKQQPSYADFGCSNGFLTSIVAAQVGAANVVGLDHNVENLANARAAHPEFQFASIDLNAAPDRSAANYDLVTCFETLEHVGCLNTAIDNLWQAIRPGGTALVTVPIEIGPRGLLKFLVKTLIYGYRLSELQPAPSWQTYFAALVRGERIGRFRDKHAAGWGTHFGFDYRDVDDGLTAAGIPYSAHVRGFTRFYLIRRPAERRELARAA